MSTCGISGGRVKSSFNFKYNFFERHCVVAQSQKRYVIFSLKKLQREEDRGWEGGGGEEGVESPKSKGFSFRYIMFFSILY